MRLHLLGICGTFMAGIALIAKSLGHDVSGSDENVYPPMSDALEKAGVNIDPGFSTDILEQDIDLFIVGNAMKRGLPIIEAILNKPCQYISAPQWLYENVLKNKKVIAISGTHGKTTTSSMVTWVLEQAGLNPSFLIGGIPQNFHVSARLTDSPYFVIEADEYDTAFFDKRSKFIHYHPYIALINNLEFDHADIFDDLKDIQKQFAYMLRIVPSEGCLVRPKQQLHIDEVVAQGLWCEQAYFGGDSDCQATLIKDDGSQFDIHMGNSTIAIRWSLLGEHNVNNALAATAVCARLALKPSDIEKGLNSFINAKRRLEIKGQVNNLTLYDDFAHHPTAIASTLKGLRAKVGKENIVALIEFASYSMKAGVHGRAVLDALKSADMAFLLSPPNSLISLPSHVIHCHNVDEMVSQVKKIKATSHVVAMSNRRFGDVFNKLLDT